MAKPANSNSAEAGNSEASLRTKENDIRTWRRILKNDPTMARAAMHRAMGIMLSQKIFSQWELAQFYSQMANGVACPGEFGTSEVHGCPKRA